MKQKTIIIKQSTIDQFEFQIYPIQIIFNTNINQDKYFYLYFQKGAQVLGRINQQIHIPSSSKPTSTTYQFQQPQPTKTPNSQNTHIKKFRIANDKNLLYQWSLYKLTNSSEQQYLQSTQFNIKNKYQQFLQQYSNIEEDLHRIYYEKEKKLEIQEIWKDLKNDFMKREFQLQCNFVKTKCTVRFKIVIKTEYDFKFQKWQDDKAKAKQLREFKKRNSLKDGNSSKNNKSNDVSFISEKAAEKNSGNDGARPNNSSEKNIKLQSPHQQRLQKKQNTNILTQLNQPFNQFNPPLQQQLSLRQSQIHILDPQGIDVTQSQQNQIPQKFKNHKRILTQDQYQMYSQKKASMLSDIIEQSYQGSSNVNAERSALGEKLKMVDQIHEEQESSIFSPLVKTQTFQSQKHNEMFEIKRTATFKHRPSQQFDTSNNTDSHNKQPSKTTKKSHLPQQTLHYSSFDTQYDQQNQQQMQLSQIKRTNANLNTNSSRKSSEIQQRQKQSIDNFNEAHKITIKNIIKICVVLFVLIVVFVSMVRLFGDGEGEREDEEGDSYHMRNKENKGKKGNKVEQFKQKEEIGKSKIKGKKGENKK